MLTVEWYMDGKRSESQDISRYEGYLDLERMELHLVMMKPGDFGFPENTRFEVTLKRT